VKSRVLYSLLGSLVVAGCVLAAGAAIPAWAPKGKARDWAERALTAPGRVLHEKLEDNKDFRRWRKKGRKTLETGQEALEETADRLGLLQLYNAGAWAGAGFVLCFLMTLVLGVSSFWDAVALGLKVTLTLVFLQATLVFAGVFAYQQIVN
jgi:hypothetical protein